MTKKKVHWLQNPNKNYLGHWDLPEGKDLTLTIKSAKWENVDNPHDKTTKSLRVIRFEEKDVKPLICNQGNATSIIVSTGGKYMSESIGKKIDLYVGKWIDDNSEIPVDCVRVRRPPKKTKEQVLLSLIELFKDVKNKLPENDQVNIQRIIDNKEILSYDKAIRHLIKIQNG